MMVTKAAVVVVALAAIFCVSSAVDVRFQEGKLPDALKMDDKAQQPASEPEKPNPGNDCDKNKFHEGISNCETGLKPLEKLVSEKKSDESCKLLKTYLSCIDDFQLFLSCESDPAADVEKRKVADILAKNKLSCAELMYLSPNATTKAPGVQPGNPAFGGKGIAPTQVPLVPKKCNERKLMRRMVECLKNMKAGMEPLLDNKKINQRLICGQTESFKSCVNLALAHTECNTDEEVLDQTTHFIVHVLYEHRWACKEVQTSEKKCEERSLVLKLNQCVRLLNKTVEPIIEDKENNKLNICRASDTFLLCVNEAVSETACREDSEVMFHVSHFADKILRHHKWSCDRNAIHGSTEKPKIESLRQKLEGNGSGNGTQVAGVSSAVEHGSNGPGDKCNFEVVRSAVDTCQQSAYDQIKKKGISQPKHLCAELKLFKDCSIEATKKNGCSTDKNAETYVYDRVKDSFYKYLTDCRPLWSAANPSGMVNSWVTLSLAVSTLSLHFLRQ
ncbi:uncharacterized protein LOC135379055 isoform X2 [Ornithodoros turicata]|uniref:uncharacterized protein LOC135379055 isoform X2 n=1 Tax=Ornithodoros turicata TaxID=34597 RepID=UPI0031389C4C